MPRIGDSQIDLAGFLEGSESLPLQWSGVPLSSELSLQHWESIEHYKLRAREFLSNVGDLNLGASWNLSVDRELTRARAEASGYPGRHRAKSLYLDFRHFTAVKEPANFSKVINILRQCVDDETALTFLSQIRREFLVNDDLDIELNGEKLNLSKMLLLWFNTEFFHAGYANQVLERKKWLAVVEDESVAHLIYWAVVRASHPIKCLFACVKDLSQSGGLLLNCPDRRIVYRDE